MAATTPKFDGAHFFAGHEDAIVPGRQSRGAVPVQGSSGSASQEELEELEARLVAAEARAQEREAQLEDARMAAVSDLESVRAAAAEELADTRAAGASELARVQGRAGELEGRVAHLQRELESSTRGREDAGFLEERIRTLERELEGARSQADRARREAEAAWNVEKASWASERARFEQERGRWAATAGAAADVEERMEQERAAWEQEREELVERAKDQIAEAADGLRGLIHRFDVPLFSRESGLGVLVDALGRYLEKHGADVSEQLLVAEVEKRNAIARELEGAKAEIQALQARSPSTVSVLHCFCRRRMMWTVDFSIG